MNIEELKKKTVKAVGEIKLVAAKGGDGNESKRMMIDAYNGDLMNVGWGLPIGIELSGLTWREDSAIPILCLHENALDAICGQSTEIRVEGRSLKVEGDFMPVSESARKVYELAKSGYRFQASVGVSPSEVEEIEPGNTATLNGEEVNGPCYIVREGELNEVSIVPLGADGSTNTAIEAAKKEEKNMEAKKPQSDAGVEAAAAERARVAAVVKACKGHDDVMAEAIEDGWNAERAELECLRAEKAAAVEAAKVAEIEAKRPAAPSIIDLKAAAPKDEKTITAAACMGASMSQKDVEAQFKGVDLDAAHDLGIGRMSDIFAAYGFDYRPGNDASMAKAIKAAFSTVDIPNVLSNVARKFALVGFGEVGEDWREVSRSIPVADFKTVKGVRLVMGGVLQPLAKGGELKHVSLTDNARDLAAETKGSIVGITREDLVNDDLGVLAMIPQRFGQMAGRTINKDVFDLIAGLATSVFGANTTGALTLDNLAAAYALAMGIKDADGNPIAAMPNKILTAPGSYIKARGIHQSEQITGASAKDVKDNTMRGLLDPIGTPWLTGTKYWLFNAAFPLVDIAFLNGRQAPVIETAQADFHQLGIEMRCYFDFGVARGDTEAALVSTGV